jgi:hypothetical protein
VAIPLSNPCLDTRVIRQRTKEERLADQVVDCLVRTKLSRQQVADSGAHGLAGRWMAWAPVQDQRRREKPATLVTGILIQWWELRVIA